MPIQEETIEQVNLATSKYKYGFSTDLEVDKAPKGLTEDTIRLISSKKDDVLVINILKIINKNTLGFAIIKIKEKYKILTDGDFRRNVIKEKNFLNKGD